MRRALLALWVIAVVRGAERGAQGIPLVLEELLRHPARVTAELRAATGRWLGRYEVVPLWAVVRPWVQGVPDSVVRAMVLVVTAADGARVALALAETLPSAALPPLLLLRRAEGSVGDTVRVPVRAGKVADEVVEAAVMPAVRLRYRIQSSLRVLPALHPPALVVGADRTTVRWLSQVVRVELVAP